MTQITISEFRKNLKLYSSKIKQEDILVVSNGKPIMRISDPLKDKVRQMENLQGILNTDKTFEEIMEEKLLDIWEFYLIHV